MVTDSYKLVTPSTRVIHVSIDPDVIGMNFPTEIGLVSDARAFLDAALDAAIRLEVLPSPAAVDHATKLAAERAAWHERRVGLAAQDGLDGSPMRPEAIMATLDRRLADDAVLVADTGYSSAWAVPCPRPSKPAGTSSGRTARSAGRSPRRSAHSSRHRIDRSSASPVTVASAITSAISRRPSAHELPVIVVILNNQTLAFEEHVQHMLYGKVVPEVNEFVDINYGAIARAFGANGFRVANVEDFERALATGLKRSGPTIIDAVIDRESIAPVTRYDRVRHPRAMTITAARIDGPGQPEADGGCTRPSRPDIDTVRSLIARYSNWGRWGPATSSARSITSARATSSRRLGSGPERARLLVVHPGRRERAAVGRLRSVQPDPPDDPGRQRRGDRHDRARLLRRARSLDPRARTTS
jgi:hypothetical protein